MRGKIHNAAPFCLRQRHRPATLEGSLGKLQQCERQATRTEHLDALRGYEGTAAAHYFTVYRHFLKQDLGFTQRIKHPPTDPVNVLLSLGYTLLFNNVHAMVNMVASLIGQR